MESARLSGSRGRRTVIPLLLGIVTLTLAVLVAGAAAAGPTTTVTVQCYRGVDVNPGEGPGVGLTVTSPSGLYVWGRFFECPAGGAGTKFVERVPFAAATVSFNCWNGFIATNNGSGPRGECLDTVPDPDVAFAKFTVRLPRLPAFAAAQEACAAIGGTFAAPGTDVTGNPFPGATLIWTCNDWPRGLTPAPSPSNWLGYCQGDGGDGSSITSNQPPAGQRTGISCFDVTP